MKRNWRKNCPANIEKVNRDHMPVEVATEMLCRPVKMSNRERKDYMAARYVVYTSTRSRVPVEDKLARKLKGAHWAQLTKWLARTNRTRKDLQDAFKLAIKRETFLAEQKPDQKNKEEVAKLALQLSLIQRTIAVLNLKAAQVDAFWDALDTEMGRRKEFIEQLKAVDASVAASVEKALCPA